MKICIFGDSITHGVSDIEGGGWATRLMTYFWDKWDEYGNTNIYPLGIDGDTASGVLVRFEAEAASRRPDAIIFAIGINDSIFFKDGREMVSLLDFERDVRLLTEKALQVANTVIFVGPTSVEDSKVQPTADSTSGKCYSNDRIKIFDLAIEKNCRELKLPYLRMHDLLEPNDLDDGYHPNPEGHRKMFERVRDFMARELSLGENQ